jgi:WD40 repeat protein
MLRRIWAVIAILSACLGAAAAQDQSTLAIFPQLGAVSPILSIALSPDGKMLASGGADNTVNAGEIMHRLAGEKIHQ